MQKHVGVNQCLLDLFVKYSAAKWKQQNNKQKCLAILQNNWSQIRLEPNLLKSLRSRHHKLKNSSAIQPRRKERSSTQYDKSPFFKSDWPAGQATMYVGSTPWEWAPHDVWVPHHVSGIRYQIVLVSELDLDRHQNQICATIWMWSFFAQLRCVEQL